MIKNRYKDDYERLEAGQYQYVGKHFALPMNPKEKKRAGVWNFLTVIAFFALEIGAGLLNADSSRTFWIVFPYLFLFLPTAYMLLGACSFWMAPVRMQHAEYQNSLVRLRRSCIAVLILGGVCILLDILFIALHFSEIHLLREFFYIFCFIMMEILGILYGKGYDRMYGGLVIDG